MTCPKCRTENSLTNPNDPVRSFPENKYILEHHEREADLRRQLEMARQEAAAEKERAEAERQRAIKANRRALEADRRAKEEGQRANNAQKKVDDTKKQLNFTKRQLQMKKAETSRDLTTKEHLKIIMLGAMTVGKTSLLMRFKVY